MMNVEKLYKRIYCCEDMYNHAATACRHHPNGCPDNNLKYDAVNGTDEREIQAGIWPRNADGSGKYIPIKFCPFCGFDLDTLAGPVIGFHLK